jgi:hypothetical protein
MITVRNKGCPAAAKARRFQAKYAKLSRRTCQGLKQVSTNLGMVRLQLHVGLMHDAVANLASLHEEVQTLRLRLEGKGRRPGTHALSALDASEENETQDNDHVLLAECLG